MTAAHPAVSAISGRRARLIAPFVLPILSSLYPPLAAGANVPGELLRLGDLAWPVGVTLGVAATAWLLAYATSRSLEKAALASVGGVVAYSSLGWVVQTLDRTLAVKGFDVAGPVVLLYVVALASSAVALISARHRFTEPVRFLTIMAAFLVAWNAAVVARTVAGTSRLPAPPVATEIAAPSAPPEAAPDIYLIVLDKYTGSAVLASHFGFDNSAFESALRRRGFVVPRQARANYVHTFLALAAMLNLRYLDDLTARFGPHGAWDLAYPLVENNRLVSFLRARGYRFFAFPTAFGATRQNRYADVQLPAPRDVRPEIHAAWVHTTAGPVLRHLICRVTGCEGDAPPYLPAPPRLMDWRFRTLASLPAENDHPLFVFAHLLVPHEPYIYGADCQHRRPYWPKHDHGAHAVRVRDAYLDQIQCVNAKLLQVIDGIRARSRVPPVILLQADHGHGRFGHDVPELDAVSPAALVERTSVFAAYYLPGLPADSVPETISPVNATRLVLRHYFRANLPAVPDRTFWSSTNRAYRFVSVE